MEVYTGVETNHSLSSSGFPRSRAQARFLCKGSVVLVLSGEGELGK